MSLQPPARPPVSLPSFDGKLLVNGSVRGIDGAIHVGVGGCIGVGDGNPANARPSGDVRAVVATVFGRVGVSIDWLPP